MVLFDNWSFKLVPNIIFYDLSNLLLKSNDYNLLKIKKNVIFISESLNNISYNMS